jgi:hypothetical protein
MRSLLHPPRPPHPRQRRPHTYLKPPNHHQHTRPAVPYPPTDRSRAAHVLRWLSAESGAPQARDPRGQTRCPACCAETGRCSIRRGARRRPERAARAPHESTQACAAASESESASASAQVAPRPTPFAPQRARFRSGCQWAKHRAGDSGTCRRGRRRPRCTMSLQCDSRLLRRRAMRSAASNYEATMCDSSAAARAFAASWMSRASRCASSAAYSLSQRVAGVSSGVCSGRVIAYR